MLDLEGNRQLVPSIDFFCEREKELERAHRKLSLGDLVKADISETTKISLSLFPGVHHLLGRQKPTCNPSLYRDIVQERALILTREVHEAPDLCGNIIQLTGSS